VADDKSYDHIFLENKINTLTQAGHTLQILPDPKSRKSIIIKHVRLLADFDPNNIKADIERLQT